MKKVWLISFRQARGRYYACDLNRDRLRVATVALDVPYGEKLVAPPAFVAMMELQPEDTTEAAIQKHKREVRR